MRGDVDYDLGPLELEVSSGSSWIFEIGLNVLPYHVPFLLGDCLPNFEVTELLDPCFQADTKPYESGFKNEMGRLRWGRPLFGAYLYPLGNPRSLSMNTFSSSIDFSA